MRNVLAATAFFVMGLISVSQGIGPDELPFGSVYLKGYSDPQVEKLSDSLCFNYFVEYRNVLQPDSIDILYARGIQGVRGGLYATLADAEAPFKYSWSNYAVIPARYPYPNEEVRLVPFGGYFDNDNDSMWVSPLGSVDTLSGISTYTPEFTDGYLKNRVAFNSNYFFAFPGIGRISYRPDIFMAIDTIIDPAAVVCTLRVSLGEWTTCQMAVIKEFAITAGQCSTSVKRVIGPEFAFPESITVREVRNSICSLDTTYHYSPNGHFIPNLNLSIVTTGLRKVFIDRILISDVYGQELVEGDAYNGQITGKFQEYISQGEKIYGWTFMDEPLYANFLPFHHIDSLMQRVYSDWITYPENWQVNWDRCLTRSWLKVMETDFVNPNIYPYGDADGYAGLVYQDSGAQCRFNDAISWVRNAIDKKGKEFRMIIQAYGGVDSLRRPTPSELSCSVFTSLAWGARGIQFHYYDVGAYNRGWGIRDALRNPTELYYEIKNHIGPYVQAADEYYMPLTWERCYVFHDGTPEHNPPGDAFISSISASSDSFNPDLGWFQVGEFSGGLGDPAKYLMLVNRACNIDSATAAPPVIATVCFNPANLGLDSTVYIIDLAHSVYYDKEWIGIEDTTYSSVLDGTIPFTTVLKAGEGKLFKIVKTDEIELHDTISTNYTYQGRVGVSDDAIIPAGKTMMIKGPALIEAAPSADVKLIINGKLLATGMPGDSIKFVPGSSSIEGDWYGIVDRSDDDDTLLYCAIRYGYIGFRGDSSSNAFIRHCEISHNENCGVYLVGTCGDTTVIDSSLISFNGYYGIHANASQLTARANTITNNNTNSAIFIRDIPCEVLKEYEMENNVITKGSSGTAGTGVRVEGFAMVEEDHFPAVLFSGNVIKRFSTGVYLLQIATGYWQPESGLRFNGGNAVDSNTAVGLVCWFSSPAIFSDSGTCSRYNSFSFNSTYGINCASASSPIVKETKLKRNGNSNVAYASLCRPNLGDSVNFLGNSWFQTVLYDTKKISSGGYKIDAKGNYWGEETPDPTDFYPNPSWVKYSAWESSHECDSIPSSPKIAGLGPVPERFALCANYPNPFNPSTVIAFDLPEATNIRLSIFNILGQRIRNLIDDYYQPGTHSVIWDGRNDAGGEVASGVYFYLIETPKFKDVRKMLILR